MKSEEALEQIAYLKKLTEKTRLSAARGYPYFILAGIHTIIHNLGCFFIQQNNLSWRYSWKIIILIVTIIIAVYIFKKNRKKYPSDTIPRLLKQIGMQCLILVISAIIIFLSLIFQRIELSLLIAYWPFQIGIIHLIAGVQIGRGITFIGLLLIITSVISLLIPHLFQELWLGIGSGGGVILTGLFFRYQLKKAGSKIAE